MFRGRKVKKATGVILVLLLVACQLLVGGSNVQAASKQKALNITDLSLSVGQSQKLKVSNGKKVKWSSSKKSVAKNIKSYDVIYMGYPIWWHTAPMCVGTFLEAYALQGKTVYPVSQSASMDEDLFEESVQFVKDCAKGADVEEGLFVDADDADAVEKYVQETILK